MKITIYELLGLIKEGKNPYKFIFKDDEYRWDYEDNKYYRKAGIDEKEQKYYELFEDDYNLYFCLNDKVEIIEKEIEKIMQIDTRETRDCIIKFQCKINQIIDVINDMRDKE